jgi:uncharacterized integral membrane protein
MPQCKRTSFGLEQVAIARSIKLCEVDDMRWVNLAVIIIFVVAMPIFAAQNFQSVTVTFKMSAPHAVLIVLPSVWSPGAA